MCSPEAGAWPECWPPRFSRRQTFRTTTTGLWCTAATGWTARLGPNARLIAHATQVVSHGCVALLVYLLARRLLESLEPWPRPSCSPPIPSTSKTLRGWQGARTFCPPSFACRRLSPGSGVPPPSGFAASRVSPPASRSGLSLSSARKWRSFYLSSWGLTSCFATGNPGATAQRQGECGGECLGIRYWGHPAVPLAAGGLHDELGQVGILTQLKESLLLREPRTAAAAAGFTLRSLVFPWPHNALVTREVVGSRADDLGDVRRAPVHGLECGPFQSAHGHPRHGMGRCLRAAHVSSVAGGVVAAERYAYLPSVGVALMVGGLFRTGDVETPPARDATAVLALLVAVTAGDCVARARVWTNDDTLTADVVRNSHRFASRTHDPRGSPARSGPLAEAVRSSNKRRARLRVGAVASEARQDPVACGDPRGCCVHSGGPSRPSQIGWSLTSISRGLCRDRGLALRRIPAVGAKPPSCRPRATGPSPSTSLERAVGEAAVAAVRVVTRCRRNESPGRARDDPLRGRQLPRRRRPCS